MQMFQQTPGSAFRPRHSSSPSKTTIQSTDAVDDLLNIQISKPTNDDKTSSNLSSPSNSSAEHKFEKITISQLIDRTQTALLISQGKQSLKASSNQSTNQSRYNPSLSNATPLGVVAAVLVACGCQSATRLNNHQKPPLVSSRYPQYLMNNRSTHQSDTQMHIQSLTPSIKLAINPSHETVLQSVFSMPPVVGKSHSTNNQTLSKYDPDQLGASAVSESVSSLSSHRTVDQGDNHSNNKSVNQPAYLVKKNRYAQQRDKVLTLLNIVDPITYLSTSSLTSQSNNQPISQLHDQSNNQSNNSSNNRSHVREAKKAIKQSIRSLTHVSPLAKCISLQKPSTGRSIDPSLIQSTLLFTKPLTSRNSRIANASPLHQILNHSLQNKNKQVKSSAKSNQQSANDPTNQSNNQSIDQTARRAKSSSGMSEKQYRENMRKQWEMSIDQSTDLYHLTAAQMLISTRSQSDIQSIKQSSKERKKQSKKSKKQSTDDLDDHSIGQSPLDDANKLLSLSSPVDRSQQSDDQFREHHKKAKKSKKSKRRRDDDSNDLPASQPTKSSKRSKIEHHSSDATTDEEDQAVDQSNDQSISTYKANKRSINQLIKPSISRSLSTSIIPSYNPLFSSLLHTDRAFNPLFAPSISQSISQSVNQTISQSVQAHNQASIHRYNSFIRPTSLISTSSSNSQLLNSSNSSSTISESVSQAINRSTSLIDQTMQYATTSVQRSNSLINQSAFQKFAAARTTSRPQVLPNDQSSDQTMTPLISRTISRLDE